MMKRNQLKILLDLVMSVLLLFLMAFQVTGDEYHEWIGAGMLLLFLLHNGLNIGWYRGIFKGRYSFQRGMRTIVNLLVLVAILLTAYSGIVMSRYVFSFLPIAGGMATARKMHLAGSYWSFVLMSIHLGMHWSVVMGKLKKQQKKRSFAVWIARAVAFAIAVYGALLFGRAEIFANMFLQNEFAILDFDKAAWHILLENLAMMGTWVYAGHYLTRGINKLTSAGKKKQKGSFEGILCVLLAAAIILCAVFAAPGEDTGESWGSAAQEQETKEDSLAEDAKEMQETQSYADESQTEAVTVSDEFVRIAGGTYDMGSPETENWRSADETRHSVTVSDFYISIYEVTQEEYETVMGGNPASFSGENLPIENVSWLDAVAYCNARSEEEGLTPAYQIDGGQVSWDRGADGYRLPTEAEWEYACRAGTTTPFNTETSISAEESNYYGHYPYEIEGNYFEQGNLTTQPGQYRETTVAVDSFSPNAWGLYNMHGNVSEWVWDYYGAYDTGDATDPTGPVTGTLRVYRGGGWNDFAKNMRSAYRATLEETMGSFNIGIRLVRNAVNTSDEIIGGQVVDQENTQTSDTGNILIAYFSWGGNTRGVAEEIQAQTGADLFEITLVEPYSDSYNTVLDQSQHDQNIQARPEIADQVENMDSYDTILLGYPNWWASIPMPIASFLEQYDFSGKTIVPFCSHGGGRFGQSLTAIAKLAPDAVMGEGLSVHYSGGSSLPEDVTTWLQENGIME